jgi:hypothetical protein
VRSDGRAGGVGDQEAGRGREEGGEGSVTTRTLTFFWL